MLFSLIIPTVGNRQYLRRCLRSILAQSTYPDEVILLFDGVPAQPPKDIVVALKRRSIRLKIIELVSKVGSGVAKYRGLVSARGRFVGFTDDDCFLEPLWVHHVLSFFQKNSDAVIIQGRSRESPKTFWGHVFLMSHALCHPHAPIRSQRAAFVDAKNFAVRRDFFLHTCPFIDTQFAKWNGHYADSDLAMRLHRMNIPIYYDKQMRVVHAPQLTFIQFVKKQFTQGRAYFTFHTKWRSYILRIRRLAKFFKNNEEAFMYLSTLYRDSLFGVSVLAKRWLSRLPRMGIFQSSLSLFGACIFLSGYHFASYSIFKKDKR